MRRWRAGTVLLIGFAPGLLSCALINQCTYEERSVTGFNAVIENGEATLRAELLFNENKGSLNLKRFNPNITGTLKGHVTSIVLTSTADHPSSCPSRSTSLSPRPSPVEGWCNGQQIRRQTCRECTT